MDTLGAPLGAPASTPERASEEALQTRVASLEAVIAAAAVLLPSGSVKSRLLSAIPGYRLPTEMELLRGNGRDR